MADQPIDYAAVRADLLARLAEIDTRRHELVAAVAAVEKILVSGIAGAMAATGATGMHGSGVMTTQGERPRLLDRKESIFKEMTIVDGARLYLESKKKPQSAREIAEALKHGGYEFRSDNPTNTVNAVLYRASDKGQFKKLGNATYALPD